MTASTSLIIRAELHGDDTATALGITRFAHVSKPRGDVLCLKVRSIGGTLAGDSCRVWPQ
jgi:hypothetical protein